MSLDLFHGRRSYLQKPAGSAGIENQTKPRDPRIPSLWASLNWVSTSRGLPYEVSPQPAAQLLCPG
jgi:hypothetical protein